VVAAVAVVEDVVAGSGSSGVPVTLAGLAALSGADARPPIRQADER
jgi:hypothetical protein